MSMGVRRYPAERAPVLKLDQAALRGESYDLNQLQVRSLDTFMRSRMLGSFSPARRCATGHRGMPLTADSHRPKMG